MFSHKIIQQGDMQLCQLSNGWMTVETSSFGARLYRILMPDNEGKVDNILLNYDNPNCFEEDPYCFGATAGPVAGRIANAKWKDYTLEKDDFGNALHCGRNGWQNQNFQLQDIRTLENAIEVVYVLNDNGVTGLPGSKMKVIYRLTSQNDLVMIYQASTLEETLWNPTNHAYFNLSGQIQSIRDHQLMVNASKILETTEGNLPTGKFQDISGTDYDFKALTLIEKRIPNGLDDCYILENDSKREASLVLQHSKSGRKIDIYTDRDVVVLFTGTGMTDHHIQVNGHPLISEEGLAIEFQEVPDAVNNGISDIILYPNQPKEKVTTYHFSII